jgi:hypothetical protein
MRSECPFQTSFADIHRRGRCAPRPTSPCSGYRSQQGQRAFHTQNLCRFARLFRPAAQLRRPFSGPGSLAAKVKPQHDALAIELHRAPVLHTDEISWWVVGPGWRLWVFTTQLLTFYVVAQSRGRELLSGILGKDFGGVLVNDCLAIYDDAARSSLHLSGS